MRVLILAVFLYSTLSIGEVYGRANADKAMDVVPPPVIRANYSSFRGISLSSRPDNVRWQAQSLGFDTFTAYFVGGSNVSAITISFKGFDVGRADFDRTGNMVRLALGQRFLLEQPIFVRKFADDLFEFYEVKTRKVDDDVCFQDVTCFRGVSKFGEQFLILRIGTDVQLYVRPATIIPYGG